jgi:urea transport system ATP-binding protein
MSQSTAIYVDALTVNFSGFRALDNLTFLAEYGGIYGVIGPNGAGKTTLMDVITGITKPTSGTVLLNRKQDILRMTLPERAQAGIGRKFQRPSVFEHLTVRENVALGVRLYPDSLIRELTSGEAEEKNDRVESVLKTISLNHLGDVLAGTLAHGQKQWLEIGMVLARDPKLLMLDEPVAGMSDAERDATADLLERLRSPMRCILLVEHDMQFVGRVSDHVSVLHEGRLLCAGSMDRVTNDPEVIRVYLGR